MDGQQQLTPAGRRIVAAAEELFYERGITAVGVDLIAERSGVTKRTLYNRFGSKDHLVAACLTERDRRWRSLVRDTVDACDDPVDAVVAPRAPRRRRPETLAERPLRGPRRPSGLHRALRPRLPAPGAARGRSDHAAPAAAPAGRRPQGEHRAGEGPDPGRRGRPTLAATRPNRPGGGTRPRGNPVSPAAGPSLLFGPWTTPARRPA